MPERKYITNEILDQLRDAVRRKDDARFHAILRSLKTGLSVRERADLLQETFRALEETAEWWRIRRAGELEEEGYSESEIEDLLDEEVPPYPALPPLEETSEEPAKGLSFSHPKRYSKKKGIKEED